MGCSGSSILQFLKEFPKSSSSTLGMAKPGSTATLTSVTHTPLPPSDGISPQDASSVSVSEGSTGEDLHLLTSVTPTLSHGPPVKST